MKWLLEKIAIPAYWSILNSNSKILHTGGFQKIPGYLGILENPEKISGPLCSWFAECHAQLFITSSSLLKPFQIGQNFMTLVGRGGLYLEAWRVVGSRFPSRRSRQREWSICRGEKRARRQRPPLCLADCLPKRFPLPTAEMPTWTAPTGLSAQAIPPPLST